MDPNTDLRFVSDPDATIGDLILSGNPTVEGMIPMIINDLIDKADCRSIIQASLDNARRFYLGFGRNVVFKGYNHYSTVVMSDAHSLYFVYVASTLHDVPKQWTSRLLQIKFTNNADKLNRKVVIEKARDLLRSTFGAAEEADLDAAFQNDNSLIIDAIFKFPVEYKGKGVRELRPFLLPNLKQMIPSKNL